MNYLKLILRFWKTRRSKRITNLQADLYFYLIQECNERDWENPFECANKIICGSINISEPSLIDARNRLQQLGLISFKSGKRNESSPVYFITDSESNLTSNLNNLSRNRVNPLVNSLDETEMKGEPIKEQTKRKQKVNSSGGIPPPIKKTEPNLYWQDFIQTFEEFYFSVKKEKYQYLKKDFGNLDLIYKFLKTRSEAKNIEWNKFNACNGFKTYLEVAYKEKWLQEHFSIANILSQFNQIVTKKPDAGNSSIQQSNGTAASVGALLSGAASF